MNNLLSDQLQVPGATIRYKVYGQIGNSTERPILLLIAGGEGGGDGYGVLAESLADRYTVITYDRRGAPGSPLHDLSSVVRLETHTDDAHILLSALTDRPALVFGSSAGALVGLDLALRYPEQVKALVAHEPPVEGVLVEFDRSQDEIFEALRQGGAPAAMAKLAGHIGVSYNDLEPGVVIPPPDPREAAARMQAFMRYTFPAVHRYRLDVDALTHSLVRLILATGSEGPDTPVRSCSYALAARLGKKVVRFPSNHAGYISHPKAFATKLDEVFKEVIF